MEQEAKPRPTLKANRFDEIKSRLHYTFPCFSIKTMYLIKFAKLYYAYVKLNTEFMGMPTGKRMMIYYHCDGDEIAFISELKIFRVPMDKIRAFDLPDFIALDVASFIDVFEIIWETNDITEYMKKNLL